VAKLAKKLGIRVYTIGIGQDEYVSRRSSFGYNTRSKELDISLLEQIAADTDARFFLARDENMLSTIFKTIDQLETTEVEVSSFKRYSEEFRPFALLGLFLIVIEFILRKTLFKVLPI